VCGCVTFSYVMAGCNDSTVLHETDANHNTSALQFVTHCCAANTVSTDERMLGHRKLSGVNESLTGNITGYVCIARCLEI